MIPTIGRIVHYRLSSQDVGQITRRRVKRASDIAWPEGAQAHVGNEVYEGDFYPMMIVRVFGSTEESAVNGQVFLDGSDILWVTSRTAGDQPGQFCWPERK